MPVPQIDHPQERLNAVIKNLVSLRNTMDCSEADYSARYLSFLLSSVLNSAKTAVPLSWSQQDDPEGKTYIRAVSQQYMEFQFWLKAVMEERAPEKE